MKQIEVIEKCQQILRKDCDDPAGEIIKMGNVLVSMGTALKGLTRAEAVAVIRSAAQLSDNMKPVEPEAPSPTP